MEELAAGARTVAMIWFILNILVGIGGFVFTLLACLCCCGVMGESCCWYDCYGCKKKVDAQTTPKTVQTPA